jgi:hypothetical protein
MYLKYIDDLADKYLIIGKSTNMRKGLNQCDSGSSVINPQHSGLGDNGILS